MRRTSPNLPRQPARTKLTASITTRANQQHDYFVTHANHSPDGNEPIDFF